MKIFTYTCGLRWLSIGQHWQRTPLTTTWLKIFKRQKHQKPPYRSHPTPCNPRANHHHEFAFVNMHFVISLLHILTAYIVNFCAKATCGIPRNNPHHPHLRIKSTQVPASCWHHLVASVHYFWVSWLAALDSGSYSRNVWLVRAHLLASV